MRQVGKRSRVKTENSVPPDRMNGFMAGHDEHLSPDKVRALEVFKRRRNYTDNLDNLLMSQRGNGLGKGSPKKKKNK